MLNFVQNQKQLNMLELKIKEISSHLANNKVREITEDESEELQMLKKLGFESTPRYKELKKIKGSTEVNQMNKSLETTIKDCGDNGFKILPTKFIKDFLKKYNLEPGSTVQYVYDIPVNNLKNIHSKIESFIRFCHDKALLKTFYSMYDTHNWNYFQKGEELEVYPIKNLVILAPKEHFDRELKVEDPDPVAMLQLSEGHYLYLDAWDIEKVMFDNDTRNPELLN